MTNLEPTSVPTTSAGRGRRRVEILLWLILALHLFLRWRALDGWYERVDVEELNFGLLPAHLLRGLAILNLRKDWDNTDFQSAVAQPTPHYPTGPLWAEVVRPLPPTATERQETEKLQSLGDVSAGDQLYSWTVRGIRELRLGQIAEGQEHLRRFNDPCAVEGSESWLAGDIDKAIQAFALPSAEELRATP